jgi:hypothetical protein
MPATTVPYETFQFNSGTYQALSPVVACDRSTNLYPEVNPSNSGAKAPAALIGRPGLTSFANVGAGPIRQLWTGNGRLFAVSGPRFYEVNPSTGAVITDYGAMGASTGTGPAQIVANGTQILVYDSSIAQTFNANTVGPAMDFVYSGFSLEYLDTFYYLLDDVVDNRVVQSATLDGTTWPGLTYVDITGTVDKKTRLIVANGYLWVMGQSNIEVWYNAGTAGFTLSRMTNGTINQGIFGGNQTEAAFSAMRIQNTVLWMGANAERGYAQFWRADGLTPVKISTPGIEAILSSYGNIGGVRGFAEEYQGHIFAVWNFPSANSGAGATLVYDLATNQWHERSYNNSGTPQRARPDCFASLQIGGGAPKNFVGDYATNDIYLQDSSYTSDDGVSIVYTRTAPHVSNSNRWLKHQCLTLDAAVGAATPTVAISDNGGVSFGSPVNMQTTGTSAAEGILTWQQWQLGRARDRVYKFVVTTSADLVRIANMWLSVEAGNEP